jgi:hypothetical protein
LPRNRLSSYVRTDKPEAVIDVRAGQQSSFKIPRTMYGIYTENVGNEIYGAWRPNFSKTQAWRTTHASLQALNARFADRAFAESHDRWDCHCPGRR